MKEVFVLRNTIIHVTWLSVIISAVMIISCATLHARLNMNAGFRFDLASEELEEGRQYVEKYEYWR